MNKFDANGNYHLKFGSSGSGRGQLSGPVGVTTLIIMIFATEDGNHRISVFHTNGQFSHIIGKGQLSQPCDVTVNTNNQLLIADWDHHCIYTFTLDGNYVSEFCSHGSGRGRLINPCSVTTDWYGFIVVAESIIVCQSSTSMITSYDTLGPMDLVLVNSRILME